MNPNITDHPPILNSLGRIGARRVLQRIDFIGEPTSPLPTGKVTAR